MAIDYPNTPNTPYEEQVRSKLDSLVENRIKTVALDRWQNGDDDGKAGETKAPANGEPELNANDIENMGEDAMSENCLNASMNASSLSLQSSGLGLNASSRDSIQSSMNDSMASFADNSVADLSASTRGSKAERKKNKRLNKKKKKYSLMLGNSSSNLLDAKVEDRCSNMLPVENKEVEEEVADQAETNSFNNLLLGKTCLSIKDAKDLRVKGGGEKEVEEKAAGLPVTNAFSALVNEDCKPMQESVLAAPGKNRGMPETNAFNALVMDDCKPLEDNRGSRSSNSNRRTRSGGSSGLPRKSKTMDESDKESFNVRKKSFFNGAERTELPGGARADSKDRRIPIRSTSDSEEKKNSRRLQMERAASGRKVLDGLAAISAHGSTTTRPDDIGRKVKIQRAVSDLTKFSDGVLQPSSSPDKNKNNVVQSPGRSDRRLRNIKKSFSLLGKSQRSFMEEAKGTPVKSPMPVRMPSRQSIIGSKPNLPTTTVAFFAGSKMRTVAEAAGVRTSQSVNTSRSAEETDRDDSMSRSVHGTSSTSGSSRRRMAAELASGYKSERNLSLEDSFREIRCGSCLGERTRASRRRSTAAAASSAPFDWAKHVQNK